MLLQRVMLSYLVNTQDENAGDKRSEDGRNAAAGQGDRDGE